MRVAVVHEWFTTVGGSERAVEQILRIYPQADVFALIDFLPPQERGLIQGKKVATSFLQRMPGVREHYRRYLPLMPLAVGRLNVSGYDLVISSSHAVAKGVKTHKGQLHICNCYSPMRYAWDLREQYLRETGLDRGLRGLVARQVLERLRRWDKKAAGRVDVFVAISQFIAERIRNNYGREAEVIYPPVDVKEFTPKEKAEGGRRKAEIPECSFYIAASRMVPYKLTGTIVEAFGMMPERTLVVIGDGPEMAKVRKLAGPNVTLLGYQPHAVLRDYLRRARALVFAAEEDFGLVPVEAQACGTPVIAYGRGGARETVVTDGPGRTGVFFPEQTARSIVEAVRAFEQIEGAFDRGAIRRNAERFAAERFRKEFAALVEREWEERRKAEGGRWK
jgi:glycosyltransferase involved in cell wall biosynthesis